MSSTSKLSWPQVRMTVGKLESCLGSEEFTTLGQAPEHKILEAIAFLRGDVDIIRFISPEILELEESHHNLQKLFPNESVWHGAWVHEVLLSQVSNRKVKVPASTVKHKYMTCNSYMSDIRRSLVDEGACPFMDVKSALGTVCEIMMSNRDSLSLEHSNLFYFTADNSFCMIDLTRIRCGSRASSQMFDGESGWSLTLTDGTVFEKQIRYSPGTVVFYR